MLSQKLMEFTEYVLKKDNIPPPPPFSQPWSGQHLLWSWASSTAKQPGRSALLPRRVVEERAKQLKGFMKGGVLFCDHQGLITRVGNYQIITTQQHSPLPSSEAEKMKTKKKNPGKTRENPPGNMREKTPKKMKTTKVRIAFSWNETDNLNGKTGSTPALCTGPHGVVLPWILQDLIMKVVGQVELMVEITKVSNPPPPPFDRMESGWERRRGQTRCRGQVW